MTNDQIAELESVMKQAEAPDAEDPGGAYWTLADAVPRLMEERRRLLRIVRILEQRFQASSHEEQEQCDACYVGGRLREEISFAEEPGL